MLDDDIISCCNPACTVHQQQLKQVCDQLVDCLKVAANRSIPGIAPGKHSCIAGWSQFVKLELQASQWWHKLWLDSSSPTAGVLFHIKKHCHCRYKYSVRRVRRRQDHIKSAKLAEALLQNHNRNFWSKVHQFSGNKKHLYLQLLIMLQALTILPIYSPTTSRNCLILLTVQPLQNCWIT